MSKKAVIEQLAGFIFAFLILIFAWVFLKVALAAGVGKADLSFTATANDLPGSVPCDYVLLNFLRSDSGKGLTPAEMLSTSLIDFKSSADDWFTMNYTRGNPRQRGWQIEVSQDEAPLLTTGKISAINSALSCTQLVPTFKNDYLVRLWLEY